MQLQYYIMSFVIFVCVTLVLYNIPLKMKTKCLLMEKTFCNITFLMNFSTILHMCWRCALQMVFDSSKNTFRVAFIICCMAMKNWFGSFYTFNTLKPSIMNEQKIWHVVIHWFSNQTWKSLLWRTKFWLFCFEEN